MKKEIKEIKTIGDLKKAKYKVLSVKEEIRKNLLEKLERGERVFEGIWGYEETVIPQLINALIAGHDIILLGERGQGKSRLIRTIVTLLDEYIPAVDGCEINDSPFAPICARCIRLIREKGDNVEIRWVHREERFGEKLATPDTTVADLIGDIDPIKVAQGRPLSDPEVIHFGLIPRTNRGIFAINELPDLPERVQVALFNVMEERDIQIKGYKIRLPLDILVVATANPEDYTARGRIVTPLKDRFNSMIRTHYPLSRDIELKIAQQESNFKDVRDGIKIEVPKFIGDIISEFTMQARKSDEVSQHSGVSVRMTISNYDIVIASAYKRAYILKEKIAVPRVSDLYYMINTSIGKIEVESIMEKSETEILEKLFKKTIKVIFDEYYKVHEFEPLLNLFREDFKFEASDMKPSSEYTMVFEKVPHLYNLAERIGGRRESEFLASYLEFFLEGLYIYNRLAKESVSGRYYYGSSPFMRGF
ncbi:Magnesium-chelatase 38 kDa subunit [bacterium HR19]|nr:Magnesium-chelatase 38 kDa subunit [bacterium HR19]